MSNSLHALLGMFILLLPACGTEPAEPSHATTATSSSSSSGTGGAGGAAPETGCLEFAEAFCQKTSECAPVAVEIAYGDLDRCRLRIELSCTIQVSAAETSYSQKEASACATAISKASCDGAVNDWGSVCRPSPGPRADGQSCATHGQCQSTYCKAVSANGCGVCTPRFADGDSCAEDANGCPPVYSCAANQTCMRLGRVGESCADGRACDYNLVCSAGLCSRGRLLGEPCDASTPCDSGAGLYCGAAMSCEAYLLASSEQPCSSPDGKPVVCTGGSTCAPSGNCLAPAEDLAACGGAANRTCFPPARCVEGHCDLLDPDACR